MVVNPGVSVTWSEQRTPGSSGPPVLKTYCESGAFGPNGSAAGMDGGGGIWNSGISLSDQTLRLLQSTHSPEHGLSLEVELSATIIPLYTGAEQPLPFTLSWRDRINLPASSWRSLREALGWPRPRLFELNPASFSDLAEFETAHKNLKKAERQLLAGAWDESIATSRLVAESVLRSLGYKKRFGTKWIEMKAAGYPPEVCSLLEAFNSLTSLEHHPTGLQHMWNRADARLVFHTAAMLAEYAGTLPPYEPSGSAG